MRDLTDDPTWEPDLTGLGPEEGDNANGEEVSVIGDKLGNRTRWAGAHLSGIYRVVDMGRTYVTGTATVFIGSSTSFTGLVTVTGTVDLEEGDVIEIETEIHYLIDSDASILMTHSVNGDPGGTNALTNAPIEREVTNDNADQIIVTSIKSVFTATANMEGFPLDARFRARVDSVLGTTELRSPSLTTWRVYRATEVIS